MATTINRTFAGSQSSYHCSLLRHSDGSRVPATGTVTVAVSGHLPSDPRVQLADNAKHVSNVVEGTFTM
jgi:hypothetical protein